MSSEATPTALLLRPATPRHATWRHPLQVAYRRYGPAMRRVGYVVGLARALETYLSPELRERWRATRVDKGALRDAYERDPGYWDRRPLTQEQVRGWGYGSAVCVCVCVCVCVALCVRHAAEVVEARISGGAGSRGPGGTCTQRCEQA